MNFSCSDTALIAQARTLNELDTLIPYNRPTSIPILPLIEMLEINDPIFEYVLLAYFMDENDFVPNWVVERLSPVHRLLTSKENYFELKKRLKDKELIFETSTGIYLNTQNCLWANRMLPTIMLNRGKSQYSWHTLYFICINENKEFHAKEYYNFLYRIPTKSINTKTAIEKLLNTLDYLEKCGIKIEVIKKKKSKPTEVYYTLKFEEEEKFKWELMVKRIFWDSNKQKKI